MRVVGKAGGRTAGLEGGQKKGGRGKAEMLKTEIPKERWGTRPRAFSANLGRGKAFADGFMGKFLKR